MENVYDYFTGMALKQITKRDYRKNTETLEKYGVYLGVLMEKDATELRSLGEELEFLQQQLNILTTKREQLRNRHQLLLTSCLYFLGKGHCSNITRINRESDVVYVDENSHVWVVYDDKNYL